MSKDLVAVDKAVHDLIVEKSKKDVFKEIHHVSPLPHVEAFAKLDNSSLNYNLTEV